MGGITVIAGWSGRGVWKCSEVWCVRRSQNAWMDRRVATLDDGVE